MEWDPEGDAVRSKESRARLWLTIAIAAFAVRKIYQWKQENQQREMIEQLSRPLRY